MFLNALMNDRKGQDLQLIVMPRPAFLLASFTTKTPLLGIIDSARTNQVPQEMLHNKLPIIGVEWGRQPRHAPPPKEIGKFVTRAAEISD